MNRQINDRKVNSEKFFKCSHINSQDGSTHAGSDSSSLPTKLPSLQKLDIVVNECQSTGPDVKDSNPSESLM